MNFVVDFIRKDGTVAFCYDRYNTGDENKTVPTEMICAVAGSLLICPCSLDEDYFTLREWVDGKLIAQLPF